MKTLFVWLFVVAYVKASRLQYAPLVIATTTQQLQQQQPSSAATSQYHNEDTREGFYSYGYSDDQSAKAEYNSIDGSSRGFYAYVDTNGELQTVEYIAGRRLGFQVAATNLPKAPVDNRRGPAPVKDTPEVQMAKKAHFEAYREAELRAALAANESEAQDIESHGDDDDDERKSNEVRQKQEQEQEEQRAENMLQSNLREQQQLLLITANSDKNDLLNQGNEQTINDLVSDANFRDDNLSDGSTRADGGRADAMTAYRLPNNAVSISTDSPNLLPNYSASDIGVDLRDLSTNLRHIPLQTTPIYDTTLHPTLSGSRDSLPLHGSYYSPLLSMPTYHLSPTIIGAHLPSLATSTTAITTTREKNLAGLVTHRLDGH